jgi:hypothetical protein
VSNLECKKHLSYAALPLFCDKNLLMPSNHLSRPDCSIGQTAFGSTKVESAESDNVSEYDPSDDDETLSEDEEGGTLDSITTMQQLYSIFLPMHLKLQVKSTEHKNGVSHLIIFGIQHCYDGLYQKVKRQKTSNQSVVYCGDSCTSQWRQKKKWKKAVKGTMKLGGFLVVSGPYQTDIVSKTHF